MGTRWPARIPRVFSLGLIITVLVIPRNRCMWPPQRSHVPTVSRGRSPWKGEFVRDVRQRLVAVGSLRTG